MRVTILCFSILTTVGLLTVGATSSGAQVLDSRISIDLDTKYLYAALKKLEKQAHVVFAYDENYLQLKQRENNPGKVQGPEPAEHPQHTVQRRGYLLP